MKHKKILAMLLTVAMVFTCIPATVLAEDEVPEEQVTEQQVSEEQEEPEVIENEDIDEETPEELVEDVITVTSMGDPETADITYLDEHGAPHTAQNATKVTADTTSMTTGFYYVEGTVKINSRVEISGEVVLILCDGADLTCRIGIHVPAGSSFTITAESNGEGMGEIEAISDLNDGSTTGYAAIGCNGSLSGCGNITINAGKVKADASMPETVHGAPGIGGGADANGNGPTITINGGNVLARGYIAPGIGCSAMDRGDVNININGGNVTAESRYSGVGIGVGTNSDGYNARAVVTFNYSPYDITSTFSAVNYNLGNINSTPGTITLAQPYYSQNADGSIVEYTAGTYEQGKIPFGGDVVLRTLDSHIFSGPEWRWADDVSSCDAVFTCTDCSKEFVLHADVVRDTNSQGYTTATATVTFRGETYTNAPDQVIVPYVDADGNTTETFATVVDDTMTTFDAGWYIIDSDITTSARLDITGKPVSIILADGIVLNNPAGTTVEPSAKLRIYGQSEGTGKWNVPEGNIPLRAAGIGSATDASCGEITINGGVLDIHAGEYAAAIGGCYPNSGPYTTYTVTINRGTVTANGNYGPGIGGQEGSVTIKGGTVTAYASTMGGSAGIGSFIYHTGKVTISGGTVYAKGARDAAAIGGGVRGAGNVIISGGNVTAVPGEDGAGIGGGNSRGYGVTQTSVRIRGGNIVAMGYPGIGVAYYDNNVVTNISCSDTSNLRISSTDYSGYVVTDLDLFDVRSGELLGEGVYGQDYDPESGYYDRDDLDNTILIPADRPYVSECGMALTDLLQLRFKYEFPEIEDVVFDAASAYVTFEGRHVNSSVHHSLVNGVASIDLNVLQVAEKVTPTLHIKKNDEWLSIEGVPYSIEDYITAVRNAYAAGDDEISASDLKIVDAIADYGYYAQPYLASINGWTVGEDYDRVTISHSDLSDYETRRNEVMTAIEEAGNALRVQNFYSTSGSLSYSLTFNSSIDMTITLWIAEGVAARTIAYGTQFYPTTPTDGKVLIPVTNIYASHLADDNKQLIIDFNNAPQITVIDCSPMSYIHSLLSNSSDYNKENRWKFMIAFYEYAMACDVN